ncbi:MAG: gamma-glutamylcyclotransferase [Myxococcota bacterium]
MFVFAYGSLMYEPERPDALRSVRPARLPGLVRRFNKRSRARGCARHLAAEPRDVEGFVDGAHRVSLALGTVPGAGLDGLLLAYAPDAADDVLARLAAREGPGYRRSEVVVEVDGAACAAVTWLTDPDSGLVVELDLAAQARVLAAATPRQRGERALGADYLHGVQRALGAHGLRDPYVDALVGLVTGGDG